MSMRVRSAAVRSNHAMADLPPYLDIVLDDLDELFVAPVVDPFAGRVEYLCGVDRAIADLRSRRGTGAVPIRLSLPAEEIGEDTVARPTKRVQLPPSGRPKRYADWAASRSWSSSVGTNGLSKGTSMCTGPRKGSSTALAG